MRDLKKELEQMIMQYVEDEYRNVELKEDTSLIDDLGFDSIMLVELMMEIEDEFNISFDEVDELVESFDTVGKLMELVGKMLETK